MASNLPIVKILAGFPNPEEVGNYAYNLGELSPRTPEFVQVRVIDGGETYLANSAHLLPITFHVENDQGKRLSQDYALLESADVVMTSLAEQSPGKYYLFGSDDPDNWWQGYEIEP